MTKSPRQKAIERSEANKLQHMNLETMMCIVVLKFPRGTLSQIGFSLLKERMKRALSTEFKDAEIVV
jgi:hypothetical protein